MIVSLDTVRVRARLRYPFVTALRTTDHAETLVVRVTDSDGRVGWGEAPQVWRVTGDSLAGSEAAVTGPLADAVIGMTPKAAVSVLGSAVVGNRSAKMAVDLACWDLTAQAAGQTLTQSLVEEAFPLAGRVPAEGRLETTPTPRWSSAGHSLVEEAEGRLETTPALRWSSAGRRPVYRDHTTVRTDITLSAGPIDELAQTAADRAADGFDVIKIKLGTDAATDIDRVLAVREAVGGEVRLRIDANTGWDAVEAVRVVTALEDAGADLELVEQPTRARDLDALAWVTRHVQTPVFADESVFDLDDLVDLIRAGAADGVNIKLAKCGGLTPAIEMVRVARAHDLRVMIGCMMETHIGVGAAAALAAVANPGEVNPVLVNDLDAAWWILGAPYVGGIEQQGPLIRLPDGPGAGIVGLAG